MSKTILHFNGLNGATGKPLTPAKTTGELLKLARGADDNESAETKAANKTTHEQRLENKAAGVMGVIKGIDALKLASARWGVIYHPDTPQAVRDKLQPLIDQRAGQVILYKPDEDHESALDFRARHGQGPGVVNPKYLPYYLLIVASPEQIPFKFQYSLDTQHAVGRLYFETPEEYESYVTRLLAYEQAPTRERRVAIFSPHNDNDQATYLSANELAAPLAQNLGASPAIPYAYKYDHLADGAATRGALLDLLTRKTQRPALLFTATHGLGYPKDHPRQRTDQGALVTGEWQRPADGAADEEIPDSVYVSGRHILSTDQCDGLIMFAYACYSAGTPRQDDFSHWQNLQPIELAAQPMISYLPQRLLTQGALAFIGHVERAWDYSFLWTGVGRSIDTFQSTLEAILSGEPIGHAFEYFNDRYLDLAQAVTASNEGSLLNKFIKGDGINTDQLAEYWIAHNDARAYVIFGDPYVRLQPEQLVAV